MQYFAQQIFEYLAQLKKHNIPVVFAVTLNIDNQWLAWPEPILSPDEPGSSLNPAYQTYPFEMELTWEGRKIGNYYWAGTLNSYQQAANRLLIDNMVTKIVLYTRSQNSLNCGIGVLNSAIQAIEAKDSYTRGHSDRVSHLALRLADQLSLDMTQQDVEIASKLHDIGKIGISEQVLSKPAALTAQEIELIRLHPEIGANILEPLPFFTHLLPAVRHHHEKYDGTGYPDKLAGNDIPVLARVIAVVDTYDALTSNRPYRPALPREKALKIVLNARSSQLDPVLVNNFLTLHERPDKKRVSHEQIFSYGTLAN